MKRMLTIILAFCVIFTSTGLAEAPQEHIQQSDGSVSIDATVFSAPVATLPDQAVQAIDMGNYAERAVQLFPCPEGYYCSGDEYGFLYSDNISDAVTCVISMNREDRLPNDNKVSLEFLSREDAAARSVDFLQEQFDLSTQVYEICALTQEMYDSLYDVNRDILEADLAAGSPQGATAQIDWGGSDVCYIVRLGILANGIPFLPYAGQSRAGDEQSSFKQNSSEVTLLLFPDGIHYLSIRLRVWNVNGVASDEQPILSAEQAIQAYCSARNEQLSTQNYAVDEIMLVYAVDENIAHPYWCFRRYIPVDFGDGTSMEMFTFDLIDAVTGELLGGIL